MRRLVGALRSHWPKVEILLRADSHYASPEVFDWCRKNRVDWFELPIDSSDKTVFPAAEEMASTAWKTLRLAEIAALRPGLMPELPLYAMLDDEVGATALAGRADAIAFDNGRASVVLDWKSDIAPTRQDTRTHTAQLRDYMIAIGAPQGAVVYMTSGSVHWIGAPSEAT